MTGPFFPPWVMAVDEEAGGQGLPATPTVPIRSSGKSAGEEKMEVKRGALPHAGLRKGHANFGWLV